MNVFKCVFLPNPHFQWKCGTIRASASQPTPTPIIFSPRSPLLAPYDIINVVCQPRALNYKQRFRKRAFECLNALERKNPPPRSVHAPKLTHYKSVPEHLQRKLWKRRCFTALFAACIPDPAPRPSLHFFPTQFFEIPHPPFWTPL